MSKQFDIYIEYDDNPDYGGQQAIYYIDDKESNVGENVDLVGCKIVDVKFNKTGNMGFPGRVMILTLEKPS